MNIWMIVSIIFGAVSIASAVIGATKSNEGAVGVVANLSIPVFFLTFIGLYSIPFQPGWDHQVVPKLFCVGLMITVGLVMTESNRRHNKIMIENMKKGVFYR
jgi:hypothetical protein